MRARERREKKFHSFCGPVMTKCCDVFEGVNPLNVYFEYNINYNTGRCPTFLSLYIHFSTVQLVSLIVNWVCTTQTCLFAILKLYFNYKFSFELIAQP